MKKLRSGVGANVLSAGLLCSASALQPEFVSEPGAYVSEESRRNLTEAHACLTGYLGISPRYFGNG